MLAFTHINCLEGIYLGLGFWFYFVVIFWCILFWRLVPSPCSLVFPPSFGGKKAGKQTKVGDLCSQCSCASVHLRLLPLWFSLYSSCNVLPAFCCLCPRVILACTSTSCYSLQFFFILFVDYTSFVANLFAFGLLDFGLEHQLSPKLVLSFYLPVLCLVFGSSFK